MGEANKTQNTDLSLNKTISGSTQLTQNSQLPSQQNLLQTESKEKQALALIQAGKLKKAEEIYLELIEKGSKNGRGNRSNLVSKNK